MSPSTMLRTSRKKKQQQSSRTLTLAQRIDVAIRAAAIARAEREAAERSEEDRKQVVAALALKHGVKDGLSLRLRGRDYQCTVTRGQMLTVEASDVLAWRRKDWRRLLFLRHVEFSPSPRLAEAVRKRKSMLRLPRSVRKFIRQTVNVTNFIKLRFDVRSSK